MTKSQVKEVADVKEYEKYEYFFTKAFIEGNSDYLTFCPNGCGNAILYKEGSFGKPNDVVECEWEKILVLGIVLFVVLSFFSVLDVETNITIQLLVNKFVCFLFPK